MDGHQSTPPDTQAISVEIERLARLALVEYDRTREAAAQRLEIRVSTLDSEVAKKRNALGPLPAEKTLGGRAVTLPTPEPHAHPVNGATLLDELTKAIRRYVALSELCAEAIALWVLFSHSLDAFQASPRLVFKSPEKRCGKTTALGVVHRLVPKPLSTSNVSGASLFRMIESHRPTLLIDEADTFLADAESARNVLNSGHTRTTAFTLRTVGDDHEPRLFSTWCAASIAAIGKLPSTLEDRSIVIPMRRKLPGENVERFRTDRAGEFPTLASKATRWAVDNRHALASADPNIPDGLNDRAADNWRALLAIADAAGGHWPEVARQAALHLSGGEQTDAEGMRVRLLADIRDVFDSAAAERLSSSDIVARLTAREDLPWGELRGGRPITAPMLANMLRQFGIRPKVFRSGDATPRGYLRADFADAWDRYLQPATAQHVGDTKCFSNHGAATLKTPVAVECTATDRKINDCCGVAGRPGAGDDEFEERAAIMEYDGRPSTSNAGLSPGVAVPDPLDIPPFLRRRGWR
ncbi:MAG TPA: DUF3631 domain-containing protein [Xanthobacteraceae bacterium]|nr:DUF3631 domain-containing protein [Xanthobacteraceae bacterium]